jgi:hypothetical protein
LALIREDIDDLWLLEYFPSTRAWMEASHQGLADLLALLPAAHHKPVTYADLKDASLAALASDPERILDDHWRTQTSCFEHLEGDKPDGLCPGLEWLRSELEAGGAPDRPGRASVLAWQNVA